MEATGEEEGTEGEVVMEEEAATEVEGVIGVEEEATGEEEEEEGIEEVVVMEEEVGGSEGGIRWGGTFRCRAV